jgi:hypothetical protein
VRPPAFAREASEGCPPKCEGGPVAAGYGWQAIETDSAEEGFLHLQDGEWPT